MTVPPGRTRPSATRRRASWSSGGGSERQRKSGRDGQDAETGAGRVDEHAVEAGEPGRKVERVGLDHAHVLSSEARGVRGELARPARVLLDGDDLRGNLGELRRLAARRGAEVEDPLTRSCADGPSGDLGAEALRPDMTVLEPLARDPVDLERSRRELPGPKRVDTNDGRLRLVLGSHEGERAPSAELVSTRRRRPSRGTSA